MKQALMALISMSFIALAGCQSDSARNVGGGAAIGAAAGAAIGAATGGDAGTGAAIGAGVGAAAGVAKEEYEARTGNRVRTCENAYGQTYPCDSAGNRLTLCRDEYGDEYYCRADRY
jgi:hypothetical protein